MPRYRSRGVPAKVVTPSALPGPLWSVLFDDGYQPLTTDTDLVNIQQATTSTFRLNEVGYPRAQHVPGHNSDGLFRTIETAAATGHPYEHQNEARTTEIWSVDVHTGHTERFREVMTDLQVIAPGDPRPVNTPAGVGFVSSGAFASTPDPGIYGLVGVTMDPNLCTLNRSLTSQELWAAKWFCAHDATIDTVSFRVRTATAVTGVAGYSGVGVYDDDGTTLTLLASSTDDTTLFTSTGQKTKTLSTPVDLVAGNSYWFAVLANWTGTTLEISTTASTTAAGTANSWPGGNTSLLIITQTSLPATITKASQTASTVRPMIGFY